MESKDDNKENIPPITLTFSSCFTEDNGSYRIEFRGKKRLLSPIKECIEEDTQPKKKSD